MINYRALLHDVSTVSCVLLMHRTPLVHLENETGVNGFLTNACSLFKFAGLHHAHVYNLNLGCDSNFFFLSVIIRVYITLQCVYLETELELKLKS